MEKILEVPYFSQYLDVENRVHLITACGMTCVVMGLRYYDVDGDSLDDLIERGVSDGGFCPSGWRHDYLVHTFVDHGVSCVREERMSERDAQRFRDAIDGDDPVIISMQRLSFDRRIFHMVIIVGYRENSQGELEGFFYHDPAGLEREKVTNLFVSVPVFLRDWRRMAIFPKGRMIVPGMLVGFRRKSRDEDVTRLLQRWTSGYGRGPFLVQTMPDRRHVVMKKDGKTLYLGSTSNPSLHVGFLEPWQS